MAAEHHGGDVGHGDVELRGDEGSEAGGVEHAGHADDAVAGEAGDFERGPAHGVERIGDEDEDGIGGMFGHLGGDGADDVVVGEEQIVAAHAGLAGEAGGDDDDVGIRGGGVVVAAGDLHFIALDGAGFKKIERLALGDAVHDIDENDVGEGFTGEAQGTSGADVAGSNHGYFFSHRNSKVGQGAMGSQAEWEGRRQGAGGLSGHNGEFGEHREVIGVERADSPNAIRLHGRGDLQFECVSTCDGVTLQQPRPRGDRTGRSRQHMQTGKSQQRRNSPQRFGWGRSDSNPARVGYNRIKHAKDLGRDVEGYGGVARRFEQGA